MAIAGPRLDRPSAVGDEGRPRAASLTVAAIVVVVLAVLALVALGRLSTLTLLGLSVTLLVAGMALLTRDGFGEQVVGHLLYHPGAVLAVGLSVVALEGTVGLLVAGLFLALLGVAGAWSNVFVADDLRDVTVAGALSYGATLAWIVVGVLVLWLATGTWRVAAGLATGSDPVDSLFGFLGFLALAGLLVRSAIWALPIAALTPRSKRQARRARLRTYSRLGTGVAVAAVGLSAIAYALVGTGTIHTVAATSPSVRALLLALSSPVALVPVVAVCALGAVATAAGLLATQVADHVDAGNDRLLASALAGCCFAVVLVSYLSELLVGLLVYVPILLGLVLLAPMVVVTVSAVALVAMEEGVVPTRAGGPALAAVGLFAAGIGAVLADLPAVLAFAFVAGAVVVWDVSTFGLGVTVELGHRPETRRLELSHAVLSVAVGVIAVVAVTGLDQLRRSLGSAVGGWTAVGLAALGAIVLAVAVARGEA